jgi:hypothetical protein
MAKRPRGSGGLMAAIALGAAVVGVVWYALSRSRPMRRKGVKAMGRRKPGPRALGGRGSPGLLRESILGANKQMVQSVFGPPRAAGGVAVVPEEGRQAYWEADTWYYALDPRRRTAMAIRFEQGVAREVDFVDAADKSEP